MSNTRTVVVNDNSIASLSGSSQQIVPANATRSLLIFFNDGNANAGINLAGGTAVIGGAGTITLVPNGSMTFVTGSIPENAINVIGTSGQPLVCLTSP